MRSSLDTPRVLIVEDEPLIAMLVQEWLEELGCKVIGPAASVSGALELIAGAELEGAVLDVSLGKEESFPIADELRKRRVPFVFATGYGATAWTRGFPALRCLRSRSRTSIFANW
jgi:DNA-binding response OmpR family regulator